MGSSHSLEYSTWEPIVLQMPSKPQKKLISLKLTVILNSQSKILPKLHNQPALEYLLLKNLQTVL